MARYTGPRNKLARRAGRDLGLKTPATASHASLLRRLNIPPGQHGVKGRGKISDYGRQLREKQIAKQTYGILERQFRRYVKQAMKSRGITGEKLLSLLESRLDNVVYRLGFAPTRAAARQLISHGHVLVDGQKVNIPSFQVKLGQKIQLKDESMKIPMVMEALSQKNIQLPSWLERQGPVGKVKELPTRENIDVNIDEQLIVEFYTR